MIARATWSALVAALAVASGTHASAHHDVETMIARFTERIDAGENTAEVFYRRATEFRVLRRSTEAEADLRRALQIDESYTPARRDLARLLGRKGEAEAAIDAAGRAVASAANDPERASSLVLLARLLSDNSEHPAALHACESALDLYPRGEVEWFLLRAQLLGELDRGDERPAALKAGHASTGSIVLRNAWIDALLDNSLLERALPVIEKELASSRLKSSWLLRRARAREIAKDSQGARTDLEACLAELAGRIHPARPDVTLIADRGLANALLGNTAAARADLARARAASADHWITAALERALASGEGD